jgi:hypothetical protein
MDGVLLIRMTVVYSTVLSSLHVARTFRPLLVSTVALLGATCVYLASLNLLHHLQYKI